MYRVYKDYKKGKDGDVEHEFVAMVYLINVIYLIYKIFLLDSMMEMGYF